MPSAPPRGRNLPAPRTIPPVLDPAASPIPESHQLPPHQTKVERIGDHVAALSADLREYVELRVALVKRQVDGIQGHLERLQHLSEAAKLAIPAAILLILGALFLLVTLALGLGSLLGGAWIGFLIVTLLLILSGAILVRLAKRRYDDAQAVVAQAKRQQQDERNITREQVQDAERLKARQSVV